MKRIVSLALVLLIGLFCFASCGKKNRDLPTKWVYSNGSTVEIIYGENGLPQYCLRNDRGTGAERYDWEYDEKGRLVKGAAIDYSSDYKETTDYTYDSKGNLVKEVYAASYGFQNTTDYTYDSKGNLVKMVYKYSDGDQSIIFYTYDSKGNLIKMVYTDSDGYVERIEISYQTVSCAFEIPDKIADDYEIGYFLFPKAEDILFYLW